MKMGIISGFAMSAFISMAPVDTAYANPEAEALRNLGKACYKQFEIDDMVKTLEIKLLNEDVRKYGGIIGAGVRMVAEQKVSFTWSF